MQTERSELIFRVADLKLYGVEKMTIICDVGGRRVASQIYLLQKGKK